MSDLTPRARELVDAMKVFPGTLLLTDEEATLLRTLIQEYPIVNGCCARCGADLFAGKHDDGCELVRALVLAGGE